MNWVNYWYRIDFGAGNEEVVNKYQIIKQFSDHHPTYWEFQGSNDNINWAELDVQHGATLGIGEAVLLVVLLTLMLTDTIRWFMHRGFQSGPSSWST